MSSGLCARLKVCYRKQKYLNGRIFLTDAFVLIAVFVKKEEEKMTINI